MSTEYRVFRSDWFAKKLKKIDASERTRIESVEQKLMTHPHEGKPLGYDYIREKKVGDKRVIFLVYDEYRVIFWSRYPRRRRSEMRSQYSRPTWMSIATWSSGSCEV